MDIERLIECVRKHVYLYDISHKDYKNLPLKITTWKMIAKELNNKSDAVRSKWKTLRDGYNKYKKLSQTPGGYGVKNTQYVWCPQLSFLDNHNTKKKRGSALKSIEIDSQDSDHSDDFVPSPSYQSSTPPPPQILQTQTLAPSTSRDSETTCQKIKRPRRSNELDEEDEVASKKLKEHDGIDYLFLSYAETFKKFPPREQTILKLRLAKLFADTELSLLSQDYSYQNLASPSYSNINTVDNIKMDIY